MGDNRINIIIAADSRYLRMSKVTVFTLSENTEKEIAVHLIYNRLTEDEITDFRHYLKDKCRALLYVYKFRTGSTEGLYRRSRKFTPECMNRIFAHLYLPSHLERALYVDADLIFTGNIDGFYGQDLGDKCMAVMPDANCFSDSILAHKKKLGISETHVYFNSGVLLLNLRKVRNEYTEAHIKELCAPVKKKTVFPDQDILNYIYQDKVIYCPWEKYNFQVHAAGRVSCEDIRIMHFTANTKPLKGRTVSSFTGIWREAAKRSGAIPGEEKKFRIRKAIFFPERVLKRILRRSLFHNKLP